MKSVVYSLIFISLIHISLTIPQLLFAKTAFENYRPFDKGYYGKDFSQGRYQYKESTHLYDSDFTDEQRKATNESLFTGVFEDKEFGLRFALPAYWHTENGRKGNTQRWQLHHRDGSLITLEIFKEFKESLTDYKSLIVRQLKFRYRSFEKITDRSFSQPDKEGIVQNERFLVISRFYDRRTRYLQRAYGIRIKDYAAVINFVATEKNFYRHTNLFNAFVSRFQLNVSPTQKTEPDTKKENPDKKPATDLKLDNNNTDKKDSKVDTKKDLIKTDPTTVTFDYYLLDNGNWGHCVPNPKLDLGPDYELKKFFDGKEGMCKKE